MNDLEQLPGADLVLRGLVDARASKRTAESALVRIAAGRLAEAGLRMPTEPTSRDWELDLYERLADVEPERDAYEVYSAWLEALDSFLDALDRIVTDDRRV